MEKEEKGKENGRERQGKSPKTLHHKKEDASFITTCPHITKPRLLKTGAL